MIAAMYARLCFLTVSPGIPLSTFDPFFQGLRNLSYVDEQTITIDYLSADGQAERFPALASDCLRFKADIIVATTTDANDPTALRDAFQQAGFRDVDVRPVPFTYRFQSLADALRNVEEAQPPFVQLMDELSEEDRAAAWAEIRQALQPLAGPMFAAPSEALMVVGVA
jgi:hypothetical protein